MRLTGYAVAIPVQRDPISGRSHPDRRFSNRTGCCTVRVIDAAFDRRDFVGCSGSELPPISEIRLRQPPHCPRNERAATKQQNKAPARLWPAVRGLMLAIGTTHSLSPPEIWVALPHSREDAIATVIAMLTGSHGVDVT